MSKIIIGIHGLGNKPKKEILIKWWKESIDEGLQNIGKQNLDYEFDIIYWADILHEKPLDENEKDKNSKYYIAEKYLPADKNFVPKKIELKSLVDQFLYNQFDKIFLDPDFVKNHELISEYIVKKYFRELGIYYSDETQYKDYRNIIIYKILAELKKHENKEILLIAHSMGSIIAYDILTMLAPNFKINKFVTIGSPLGLPVILEKIKSNLQLSENPKTPTGVNEWINFADEEDKIAMNYNFSEFYKANKNGTIPQNFLITNNYEVNGSRNPHKAYGYLRAEKFSEIIYEFLSQKEKSWFQKQLENVKNIFRFS
ncbi:MAG: hypothetical protein IPM32_04975 [Ignavibacteriae bacterium]|nr:hypothetical protein [Ignavibacteriota bacterium]